MGVVKGISIGATEPLTGPADAQPDTIDAPAETVDLPGEIGHIGHYALVEKLGQGGMGTVYKAIHEKLKRTVAVKVWAPSRVGSESAVARFEREMEAVGQLDHANIVRALDAGESDDQHFLVMELVEGVDLHQLVKRNGPLTVPDACAAVRQAALGLHHAHLAGLVHRDVKPNNLMLTATGAVKVLDLGLARLRDDRMADSAADGAPLTAHGQLMGTYDFMAPEQWLDTHNVDARADLYSLGCTLFYLLTGTAPFSGQEYDTTGKKMFAHVKSDPPAIGSLRSDAPPALADVLACLLAKEPTDRYPDCATLAQELEPLANGADLTAAFEAATPQDLPASPLQSQASAASPVRASSVDRPARGVRRWRKSPALMGSLALLLLVALAVPTIIRIVTGRATLVLEVKDPTVQAKVSQYGVIVEDIERGTVHRLSIAESRLAPGSYQLRVASDSGLKLDTSELTLERGGRAIVRVTLEASQADAHATRTPATPKARPPAASTAPKPPLAIAPFDADQAKSHQEAWAEYLDVPIERDIDLSADVKLTLMLIPPGEFLMGSSEEEQKCFVEKTISTTTKWAITTEGPQHRVRITKPFYLGRHEVTRGQFRQFVKDTHYRTDAERDGKGGIARVNGQPAEDPRFTWSADLGFPQTDDGPVVNVSWNDATRFCQWLSTKQVGMKFVLPSEAQWEYACRAGTTKPWHYDLGDSDLPLTGYAWMAQNSGGSPHPIGQLRPNPWDLCDMYGNVWEWCEDWHDPCYYSNSTTNDPFGPSRGIRRVCRGGCWDSGVTYCRSAFRFQGIPPHRIDNLGFRVAAVLSSQ